MVYQKKRLLCSMEYILYRMVQKINKQPLRNNFTKNRNWHRSFPVNFEKFLRTPFLQNISGRMLLTMEHDLENEILSNKKYF